MAVTFLSSTLQTLYNSGTTTAAKLTTFRTGGDAAMDADIEALDRRIAAFESVLIGTPTNGETSTNYPYDRAGLRREFLDELTALLMRRSTDFTFGPSITANYTASGVNVLINQSGTAGAGGTQVDLSKTIPGSSYVGNFDLLTPSATDASIGSDGRLTLLNLDGQNVFKSYSKLIDAVFAEGDKLGTNPSRSVENVSAISPLTVDGATYDHVAVVSGYDVATSLPTYATYLLQSTAQESHVTKDTSGNAALTGPATAIDQRILLSPVEAVFDSATSQYNAAIDALTFSVKTTSTGITFRVGSSGAFVAATEIPALLQNVPNRGNEFPDVRIVSNFQATTSTGVTYLIGLSNDGKVYVTSLAPSRVTTVGTTASLNAQEYLLFFNEARIKILRAKLAYNEAVVREIQEDLRQANAALAELETQAGAVVATNSDGTLTGQTSAETLTMNLFSATQSTSGSQLFNTSGSDSLHVSSEWQQNRTNLKNYIDRRSAEAQQATLDYQNTLNRFNNAFEVMSKLQEKIDTLLKAQLRNLS